MDFDSAQFGSALDLIACFGGQILVHLHMWF